MENPTTYATHTEIVAANTNKLLYIHERLKLSGKPYPLSPSANTCDVLFRNMHYPRTVHGIP